MSLSILRRAAVARSPTARSLAVAARRSYSIQKEEDPQLNGYPDPADTPRANLPPLGWFDNLTRRNYGETVHPREEIVSMWGPDAPPIDPNTALRRFLIVATGFVAVGFAIKASVPEPHFVRREYPFDGLVKELGGLEENKARAEAVDTDN
ncbi:hypothetical protein D9619_004201 [Psilocybe cf. subviscida]|uniref:Uncharacterized protein n=1 Tax=Psilocybe cf. subviscida TaxID=2480587 RepID=A0A8H5F875_9AGAR|nr:hypothetical protein D9619_004201 [Psilocybe cf. subviscida]